MGSKYAYSRDSGKFVELPEFGEDKWKPFSVPVNKLEAINGKRIFFKENRSPVLLFFIYKLDCSLCLEQLVKFDKIRTGFESLGITPVIVTSDTKEEIEDSAVSILEAEGLDKRSFEIVSDPNLKQVGTRYYAPFHAFDQFSGRVAHGTFLIDPSGRIRWFDIGDHPFMELDYLLSEARRLFRQDLEPQKFWQHPGTE